METNETSKTVAVTINADLGAHIKAVALAADKARRGAYSTLDRVAIYTDSGKLVVVASDGRMLVEHRLSAETVEGDALECAPVLLPADACKQLASVKPQAGAITLTVERSPAADVVQCGGLSLTIAKDNNLGPYPMSYRNALPQLCDRKDNNAPNWSGFDTRYLGLLPRVFVYESRNSKCVATMRPPVSETGVQRGSLFWPYKQLEGVEQMALIMPVTLPR